MTHDPFQTLSMAYSGAVNPFGTPYGGPQVSPMHAAAIHPLAATLGMSSLVPGAIPQFGQWGYPGTQTYGAIHPLQLQQQQQLAQALLAQTVNPQLQGQSPLTANWQNPQQGIQNNPVLQNPLLQNPFIAAGLQNPLIQAVLQNPQLAQHLAWQQFQSQYPQTGSPYGQIGGGLAPQSWVGQGASYGVGHPFGQVHPLVAQQMAARALHATGISPWAGF